MVLRHAAKPPCKPANCRENALSDHRLYRARWDCEEYQPPAHRDPGSVSRQYQDRDLYTCRTQRFLAKKLGSSLRSARAAQKPKTRFGHALGSVMAMSDAPRAPRQRDYLYRHIFCVPVLDQLQEPGDLFLGRAGRSRRSPVGTGSRNRAFTAGRRSTAASRFPRCGA